MCVVAVCEKMLQRVAPNGLGFGLGDTWNFTQDNGGFIYGMDSFDVLRKIGMRSSSGQSEDCKDV